MTDDDDLERAAEVPNPWAPGGSMSTLPVPPAAPCFEPTRPAGDRPVGERFVGDRPVSGGGADARSIGPRSILARSWRPTRTLAVLALVAALVATGVWLVGRNGPGADPAADARPTPSLVDPPSTTGTAAVTGDDADRPRSPAGTGTGVVEMPPALDALPPTEIVVLTDRGEVVQLDTSTGTAVLLVPELPWDDPQLSATDNAVLLWSRDSDMIVVLRRDAEPAQLQVGIPVIGVVAEADDQFLLQPSAGSDQPLEVRLDTVLRTAEFDFPVGDPWSARPHPGGALVVPGDDGSYLLTARGSERVSAGYVVGEGRNHVLFRECAGETGCQLVLVDVAAGERTVLTELVDGEVAPGASPYWLSPDGTALARVAYLDAGPTVRFVELASGASTDFPVDPAAVPPMLAWAPDSSGLFIVADGAVVFRTRATGAGTELAGLTGPTAGAARALAVRPAASARAPEESSFTVPLAGPTGLDLVASTWDDDVIEIDVDAGTVVAQPGPPLAAGPVRLFADDAGVTLASTVDSPGFRLDDGAVPVPIEGDLIGGFVLPGPVAGTLWRDRTGGGDGRVAFDLIDVRGAPLGPTVELEEVSALGSDGNGLLLLVAIGGFYSVSPAGAVRLTTGGLLASGPTAVYARECDEVLACGVVRVDRATGERRPIDDPVLVGAPFQTDADLAGSTVSPDGDVAFVRTSRNGLSWSFVDLAAGTAVPAPGPQKSTSLVWSADGRFAAYLSGDRLQVFDRDAATLTPLTGLPAIRAFAVVRPVADPPAPIPF